MTRLASVVVLLALTVLVLASTAGGPLAPPPSDPSAVPAWLAERGAATATVAALRLGLLVVAGYLLVAILLTTAAHLAGSAAAIRWADAASLPAVRRLVRGAVGASMVVSTLAPGTLAAAERSAPPVMEWMDAAPGEPPVATAPPTAPAARPPASAAPPATVTVAPGGHLWAVAEQALATHLGRPVSDKEVDSYWRAVVERNRDRLPDPGNVDLVFPGFVVELPEMPRK